MQTKTIRRITGVTGAAALIMVGMLTNLPPTNAAQDPNQAPPAEGRFGGRGRGGPGGPGGPGGRGGPMGGPLGPGIELRDLTDAQRAQVRAIRERHADEIKPLVDRLEAARKALADGVLAKSGDLRGLAMEIGSAEGDLAFASAGIQTEVLAVLTPEQLQKMQERRTAMEARRAEMEQRRQARGTRPPQ